jgi:hypothetical protein
MGKPSLHSLCAYERRTRLNESIHLVGFLGFNGLAVSKFASGSLTALGLTVGWMRPRIAAVTSSRCQI